MTDVFGDEVFCADAKLVAVPVIVQLDEGVSALIVYAPTGVWYTNQTHGVSCNHPAAEGFAVPLNMQTPPHELGGCWGGVPNALADWIDTRVFTRFDDGKTYARVDRTLTSDEYGEAWVPVVTNTGRKGVLTYPNCD